MDDSFMENPVDGEIVENKLLTFESFAHIIDNISRTLNLNTLESVCHFVYINEIDMEDILPLINKSMKDKIRMAAVDDGLMKKESQLPI